MKLTQAELAQAIGEGRIGASAVAGWESIRVPTLPGRGRLRAYAQFFATVRSLEPVPHLVPLTELSPAENEVREALERELLRLRDDDASEPPLSESANPRLLLAARLRGLREEHWPDARITQAMLGAALSQHIPISPPTVSSWESRKNPKIPPMSRLQDYARFFATERSIGKDMPRLIDYSEMSAEERQAMDALMSELLSLSERARQAPLVDPMGFFAQQGGSAPEHIADTMNEEPDLLFRIYLPSGRLFAAEADRLLSLFRDWVSSIRGKGFRQASYLTTAGTIYEFFNGSDDLDIREEFREFSGFLARCATDPTAATEQLLQAGLTRIASSDIVARYGRETRRLSLDLRHEREQRTLAIRHSLESELLDRAVAGADMNQITALIDALVPDPSPAAALRSLGSVRPATAASFTMNISQQIIEKVEGYVIQSVQGTINLTPEARELLELINRHGGEETAELQAAVHELEEPHAAPPDRHRARQRLMKFLSRLGDGAQDIAVDLLTKYIERKAGI